MISETQKKIYNCFLKHFRNGDPYKPRVDFSDFDENLKIHLEKISAILEKYKYIKWDDFFGAPKILNPNEKCPNLHFFSTRTAIKYYNSAKEKKILQNPELQFDSILESFKYIYKFCKIHKIELKNYISYKESYIYSFLEHVKNGDVNPYSLMELGDIMSILFSLENDEKELYANFICKNFGTMKQKYFNSEKTKLFVKAATKKIEEKLRKNLH